MTNTAVAVRGKDIRHGRTSRKNFIGRGIQGVPFPLAGNCPKNKREKEGGRLC